MKHIARLLILSSLLCISVSGNECFVSGIAVDKKGIPVAKAGVIAFGWGLSISGKSEDNGSFTIDYSCKDQDTYLFISPHLDHKENFIPIMPPIWIPQKINKSLAGIKLPNIKKGTYDIGKVVVPEYIKVRITFLDEQGNLFLPKELDSRLWLKFSTANGKWIKSGSLSIKDIENAKTNKESELQMLLPEGRWALEASLNEDKGPYFYADRLVEVESSNSSGVTELVLKMSRKRKALK